MNDDERDASEEKYESLRAVPIEALEALLAATVGAPHREDAHMSRWRYETTGPRGSVTTTERRGSVTARAAGDP